MNCFEMLVMNIRNNRGREREICILKNSIASLVGHSVFKQKITLSRTDSWWRPKKGLWSFFCYVTSVKRSGPVLTRMITRPGWPPDFFAQKKNPGFLRAKRIFFNTGYRVQIVSYQFLLSSRRRQKWALLILSNYQQYLNIILNSH